MEIMIPNSDFDFNSTPYATAPTTPRRFGESYFSAPPSPGHLSEFYRDFDDFDDTKSCSGISMGSWEEKKTAIPNFKKEKTIFDDGFAFDVSGEYDRGTLPAEELFDGGKIRPLKPHSKLGQNILASNKEKFRRRERNISSLPSSPIHNGSYTWEEEILEEENIKKQSSVSTKAELTSTTSKCGSKKWRLKDFFLFRSASEGRASEKDPLRKYTAVFRKNDEKKISSGRINESKRRVPVSAHELHYTKNRAVSEDKKKKTFLPYKQGILGRYFV